MNACCTRYIHIVQALNLSLTVCHLPCINQLNDAATKREGFNMAMALEKQLKELRDAHKKAEYQSIKRIGEPQEITL